MTAQMTDDLIETLKDIMKPLNAELLFSRPVIDLTVRRDIVVKVEQYAPPSMRYSAWDRNSYDGAPDSKSNIIGRGESKQAAIRDLLDRLAEREGA